MVRLDIQEMNVRLKEVFVTETEEKWILHMTKETTHIIQLSKCLKMVFRKYILKIWAPYNNFFLMLHCAINAFISQLKRSDKWKHETNGRCVCNYSFS